MSRAALWDALRARGEVQGAAPPDDSIPWALRLLFGLGAWLASVFVLAFLGFLLSDLIRDSAGRMTIAVLSGVGAWQLLRQGAGRPFLGQVGLVLGLLMQAMLLLSIIDDLHAETPAAALVCVVGAIGYLLPSRLWRVWCCWLALFGLCWLFRTISPTFGLPLMLCLAAGGAAWLWFHSEALARDYEWLWPLAIGLSIGVAGLSAWNPVLPWATLFVESGMPSRVLTSAVACSVALAAVNAALVWSLAAHQAATARAGGVILVLILSAATFSTPALGAGVFLLLLGFGRAQPLLSVLGWIVLPLALSAHYYGLSWPLNLKALSMVLLGVLLLAVRRWILRSAPGATHA